jgi:hypothetical protein
MSPRCLKNIERTEIDVEVDVKLSKIHFVPLCLAIYASTAYKLPRTRLLRSSWS